MRPIRRMKKKIRAISRCSVTACVNKGDEYHHNRFHTALLRLKYDSNLDFWPFLKLRNTFFRHCWTMLQQRGLTQLLRLQATPWLPWGLRLLRSDAAATKNRLISLFLSARLSSLFHWRVVHHPSTTTPSRSYFAVKCCNLQWFLFYLFICIHLSFTCFYLKLLIFPGWLLTALREQLLLTPSCGWIAWWWLERFHTHTHKHTHRHTKCSTWNAACFWSALLSKVLELPIVKHKCTQRGLQKVWLWDTFLVEYLTESYCVCA